LIPACTRTSGEETADDKVATVESIEGSEVARITLSADAARRLDIQTAPVRATRVESGEEPLITIPYAAVLYDPRGETWTYTNPEPLVFIRALIRVDRITGRTAVLSSGPPPGTQVVTVGGSELLGTEYEVGEE
jgi:hypothetical protein